MKALRRYQLLLVGLCTALMCGVRLLASFYGVDAVSGYTTSSFWVVMQIIAGVFVAALCVLPQLTYTGKIGLGRGTVFSRIACVVAALAFLVKSGILTASLFAALTSQPAGGFVMPWGELAGAVFSIMSVIFFMALCVNNFDFKRKGMLLFIVGPIGLYGIRLVSNFMTLTMHPAVSVYAISLLALGFTLLFITKLGRLLLDNRIGRSYGVLASLSALSLGYAMVSTLISRLGGSAIYPEGFEWSDLVCDCGVLLIALACHGLVEYYKKVNTEKGGQNSAETRQDELLPGHSADGIGTGDVSEA